MIQSNFRDEKNQIIAGRNVPAIIKKLKEQLDMQIADME